MAQRSVRSRCSERALRQLRGAPAMVTALSVSGRRQVADRTRQLRRSCQSDIPNTPISGRAASGQGVGYSPPAMRYRLCQRDGFECFRSAILFTSNHSQSASQLERVFRNVARKFSPRGQIQAYRVMSFVSSVRTLSPDVVDGYHQIQQGYSSGPGSHRRPDLHRRLHAQRTIKSSHGGGADANFQVPTYCKSERLQDSRQLRLQARL